MTSAAKSRLLVFLVATGLLFASLEGERLLAQDVAKDTPGELQRKAAEQQAKEQQRLVELQKIIEQQRLRELEQRRNLEQKKATERQGTFDKRPVNEPPAAKGAGPLTPQPNVPPRTGSGSLTSGTLRPAVQ